MRGLRAGAMDYGATVFCQKAVGQARYSRDVPMYGQLLRRIMPFFRNGVSPVPMEETLEIMAFMEAAIVSAREEREVRLEEITRPDVR
jgi:hypothetical protein